MPIDLGPHRLPENAACGSIWVWMHNNIDDLPLRGLDDGVTVIQPPLFFTTHGLSHATQIAVHPTTSVYTTVYATILKPWETRGYVSVDM